MFSPSNFWFSNGIKDRETISFDNLLNVYRKKENKDPENYFFKEIKKIITEINSVDYTDINKNFSLFIENKFFDNQIVDINNIKEVKEKIEKIKLIEDMYLIDNNYNYMFIIFSSTKPKIINNLRNIKFYFNNLFITRNNKKVKFDISDFFDYNPLLLKKLIFKNFNFISILEILRPNIQEYYDTKFPILHKSLDSYSDKKCSQTNNGLLRGLIHSIGYASATPIKILIEKIFNSGYLEIQFSMEDVNSGVFTRPLGMGEKIDYYGSQLKNIGLILSLSILDDFDYWCSTDDAFGDRYLYEFYKNKCKNCKDSFLNKFSAVERFYTVSKINSEIVTPNDISLEKYLEAIYIPNNKLLEEFLDTDIDDKYKKLVITNDDVDMVYRKNCSNKKIEKLDEKDFLKLEKLVKNREPFDIKDIDPVEYNSINIKRMVTLDFKYNKLIGNMNKF